jgi:hypothetical protein
MITLIWQACSSSIAATIKGQACSSSIAATIKGQACSSSIAATIKGHWIIMMCGFAPFAVHLLITTPS